MVDSYSYNTYGFIEISIFGYERSYLILDLLHVERSVWLRRFLYELDSWLRDGYFVNGVTGYALYQDLLAKRASGEIELPDSFRPILVAKAVITMCNRRKKPKLIPQRKLPKTPEKWLLYKEDV